MILTKLNIDFREKIFRDIVFEYQEEGTIIIKPHPNDLLDYKIIFPENIVIESKAPMRKWITRWTQDNIEEKGSRINPTFMQRSYCRGARR